MPGLKFRVLLDSLKDYEVFRDIEVNDDADFESFYSCIIDSFGLNNDQMASFFVSDHEWSKGKEVTLMDMAFDPDEVSAEIMKDTTIRQFIESPKQRFILVYDFLNMWIFLIELQEILSHTVESPKITLKVGDIPQGLKEGSISNLDEINFETEKLDDADDYLDYENGFSEDDFENIDDLDI